MKASKSPDAQEAFTSNKLKGLDHGLRNSLCTSWPLIIKAQLKLALMQPRDRRKENGFILLDQGLCRAERPLIVGTKNYFGDWKTNCFDPI